MTDRLLTTSLARYPRLISALLAALVVVSLTAMPASAGACTTAVDPGLAGGCGAIHGP